MIRHRPTTLIVLLLLSSNFAKATDFLTFDPGVYSQTVTECDRLAAHPDDPHRVAPGVSQTQVDLARAVTACREAVARDPQNPRLNYQYARVLGYSGRGAEGLANRQAAVAADYPQALFVIGFITLYGMNQQPKEVCRAGELLRRSALHQRLAGLLGYPRYVLEGRFADCPKVRQDTAELLDFVAAARRQFGSDYYKGLLADALEEDLRNRP
jgi:hypothetical protein